MGLCLPPKRQERRDGPEEEEEEEEEAQDAVGRVPGSVVVKTFLGLETKTETWTE